jgi:hypothetical protein
MQAYINHNINISTTNKSTTTTTTTTTATTTTPSLPPLQKVNQISKSSASSSTTKRRKDYSCYYSIINSRIKISSSFKLSIESACIEVPFITTNKGELVFSVVQLFTLIEAVCHNEREKTIAPESQLPLPDLTTLRARANNRFIAYKKLVLSKEHQQLSIHRFLGGSLVNNKKQPFLNVVQLKTCIQAAYKREYVPYLKPLHIAIVQWMYTSDAWKAASKVDQTCADLENIGSCSQKPCHQLKLSKRVSSSSSSSSSSNAPPSALVEYVDNDDDDENDNNEQDDTDETDVTISTNSNNKSTVTTTCNNNNTIINRQGTNDLDAESSSSGSDADDEKEGGSGSGVDANNNVLDRYDDEVIKMVNDIPCMDEMIHASIVQRGIKTILSLVHKTLTDQDKLQLLLRCGCCDYLIDNCELSQEYCTTIANKVNHLIKKRKVQVKFLMDSLRISVLYDAKIMH